MHQARQWDLLYEEEDRFCGRWLSAGVRLLKACSELPEEAASGRLSLANLQATQQQAGASSPQQDAGASSQQQQAGASSHEESEAQSSDGSPLPSEYMRTFTCFFKTLDSPYVV